MKYRRIRYNYVFLDFFFNLFFLMSFALTLDKDKAVMDNIPPLQSMDGSSTSSTNGGGLLFDNNDLLGFSSTDACDIAVAPNHITTTVKVGLITLLTSILWCCCVLKILLYVFWCCMFLLRNITMCTFLCRLRIPYPAAGRNVRLKYD